MLYCSFCFVQVKTNFRFQNARAPPSKQVDGDRLIHKRKADDIIKEFLNSGHRHKTLDAMSREMRKVMHDVARNNGLVTRSTGKEPDRFIILSYRENRLTRSTLIQTEAIVPSGACLSALSQFVEQNPITEEEMNLFLKEKSEKQTYTKSKWSREKTAVPPKACCSKDMQKAK